MFSISTKFGNDRDMCRSRLRLRPLTLPICAALVGGALAGCAPQADSLAELSRLQAGESRAAEAPDLERRITAFCGDCHAVPRPESFSRDRWYVAVHKGFEIYAKSGRADLDPPPLGQTLAYFRARAPEELAFPIPPDADERFSTTFEQEHLYLKSGVELLPEIAHLQWIQLTAGGPAELVACDMRYGQVVAIDLKRSDRAPPRILALLRNPCRVEPCDLDRDGRTDLIAADLGSFQPAEHDRGRVVWLHRRGDQPDFELTELAGGFGRIADVRAADMDGDELVDLVVAEFGWQRTGRILLLQNVADDASKPRFDRHTIDDRPGTIHVPVADINGDGRLDFLALVSQEYEALDLFENAGRGKFHRRNLWAGPDLTFGSTGVEWVDLDGDSDRDILYTNGDAFDNHLASPWHGVQWLENTGSGVFEYHRITDMTGVYRALPADFDRDGDQDVLAVAFLPRKIQPPTLRGPNQPSIVLLEQHAPGEFRRHTLERGSPDYATLALGDFDADGDCDFAVAPGPTVAEARRDKHYLTVWWNKHAGSSN